MPAIWQGDQDGAARLRGANVAHAGILTDFRLGAAEAAPYVLRRPSYVGRGFSRASYVLPAPFAAFAWMNEKFSSGSG